MICLLYKDVLCIATASKVDVVYDIQACINIHKAKIEEADDGRGELTLRRARILLTV